MFASPPQPLPCLKSRRLCGHLLGMPDMSTTTVTRGHAKINRRLFPNTRNTARDRPSCPHSKAALLPIFKNPILGPYDQVQRVSVRTHARRISARCTLETGRRTRATSAHTHFARMTYHVKRQSHGECVQRRRWNIHTHTLARTRPKTHTHTHTQALKQLVEVLLLLFSVLLGVTHPKTQTPIHKDLNPPKLPSLSNVQTFCCPVFCVYH